METKALDGQSLFDLAVQHCGSAQVAFEIAELNGMDITAQPTPGQSILLPEVVNKQIADYFAVKDLTPATTLSDDLGFKGIGFWEIEDDFIVS